MANGGRRSGVALPAKDDLRIPKLALVVADRLRQRIVAGDIKSGSRLPPETEMLEEFSISRPTLREALRILESEGLITLGRGMRTGAEVLGPRMERAASYASVVLVSNSATLAHIQEVRLLLEPSIAAALARRPNRKGVVDTLRGCLTEEVNAFEAGRFEDAVTANNEFHEQLVSSWNNPVLTLLMGMLHSISAKSYAAVLMGDSHSDNEALKKNMSKSITGNKMLVDLIAEGKADEAEAFWRRYLERTMSFLARTGLGARRIRYETIGA
jgi:DNA-binding FadR family transcriptional regulator